MKIGIIGAGNVGGVLGTAWCRKGHKIVFGTRNPTDAKIQKLIGTTNGQATAERIADAVAQCDIILLATHWEGLQATLQSVGSFAGRILILFAETPPAQKRRSSSCRTNWDLKPWMPVRCT